MKRLPHLLLGKHQGPARPPTGQHAPGLPPTGGDPTRQRSSLRWSSLHPESLATGGQGVHLRLIKSSPSEKRTTRTSPVCSFRGHAGPTMETTRDEPHATTWRVLKELSVGGVGVRLTLELNDTRKWRMKSNHLRRQDSRAWESEQGKKP